MNEATITTIAAINQALADAMEEDDRVLVLGEDVADPEGGGIVGSTRTLSSRFGEGRVRSTPIAEQAIVGAAIGASLIGYKPVAEIMLMNFTTVAMDMIVNHAAKLRFMSGGQTHVPIVVRTMTGAGRQTGGQHADYLEAWFAHTPGLKVVAPATPEDAYGLLRSCIDDPDPCIFIETISTFWTKGQAPKKGLRIPLGQAKVLREGNDITIVSYGSTVSQAVAAAGQLSENGIQADVIDLRTIAPWDRDTVLMSARKTGRVLIAHEAVQSYGVSAEIGSVITERCFTELKQPVKRLGAPNCPVPFSKPLEAAFMVDRLKIVSAVEEMFQEKVVT